MKQVYFMIMLMAGIGAENNAPVVRITEPADRGFFRWGSVVNYSISVEDKEDGNSAYNEIPGNEVLLKVSYLADSFVLHRQSDVSAGITRIPPALSAMVKSNCFNCHAVRDKLIGPAFAQIAGRYPYSPAAVDMLMKKVINGSSGVWGSTVMPSHPDIQTAQLKAIVDWILKSSADPNQCYYTGLEGTFRANAVPGKAAGKAVGAGKAVYVLTASYTDHGLKDMPQASRRGTQTIVLRPAGNEIFGK